MPPSEPHWTWMQLTGQLYTPQGALCAQGYSGHDAGRNNPALQASPNIGPLPWGLWTMGECPAPGGRRGPMAIPLEPYLGTQTCGRSGFYIHGDTLEDVLDHTQCASHGCVVIGPAARKAIIASGVKHLLVE